MKRLITALLFFSSMSFAYARTKGHVWKKTKEFYLQAWPTDDHFFFGYGAPDTTSTQLICFSMYTYQVKDNPHHCSLGAYYETMELPEGDKIYFISADQGFAKMKYLNAKGTETVLYFKRRDIVFDNE